MKRRTTSLIMAAFVLSIAAIALAPFGEGIAEPVVLPDTAVRP